MSYPAVSAIAPRVIPAIQVARALFELTKPRLAAMSVLTTTVAYLADAPEPDRAHLWPLLGGTALAAGGALALNQWRERSFDAMMRRTCTRPLPRHQVPPAVALAWSAALSVAGVLWLACSVNLLASLLSAATIAVYAFVYTPLKRVSRWATEIGAISGALPPLIGSAADGAISGAGWTLFAFILLWQMPHFYAIGWVHRVDYRAAGFRLLPAIDADGTRTGGWTLGYAAALTLVAPCAWRLGAVGPWFAIVAGGAAVWILGGSVRFARAGVDRTRAARELFRATLICLPLALLTLFVAG